MTARHYRAACVLSQAPKHTMTHPNSTNKKTTGSTETPGIIEHDAMPDAQVEIALDDTRLTLTKRTKTDVQARHETDEMLCQTITDDPTDIRELINDISCDIPDDVERTARRLLQLDAWLEGNDPTRARDSPLSVHGTYRPLRNEQNQLFLIEEGSETMCDRVLPIVVSLHKPTWSNRNQAIKPRLSQVLQERALRAATENQVSLFEKNHRTIIATKFQKVDSLEEAERIVTGEPRVQANDSPDTAETTDQASLNTF